MNLQRQERRRIANEERRRVERRQSGGGRGAPRHCEGRPGLSVGVQGNDSTKLPSIPVSRPKRNNDRMRLHYPLKIPRLIIQAFDVEVPLKTPQRLGL